MLTSISHNKHRGLHVETVTPRRHLLKGTPLGGSSRLPEKEPPLANIGGERLFIFQRTLNFPLTLALFYNLTFVVLFLTASEAELKL